MKNTTIFHYLNALGKLTKRVFDVIMPYPETKGHCTMNDSGNVDKCEQYPERLGFMFKKISVTQGIMMRWLSYPDFVREIESLISNNITIDDKSVYEVVKKIYFPLRREREIYGFIREEGVLNHSKTRSGLRKLGMVLFDNPDKWESDYQEFLNQL